MMDTTYQLHRQDAMMPSYLEVRQVSLGVSKDLLGDFCGLAAKIFHARNWGELKDNLMEGTKHD